MDVIHFGHLFLSLTYKSKSFFCFSLFDFLSILNPLEILFSATCFMLSIFMIQYLCRRFDMSSPSYDLTLILWMCPDTTITLLLLQIAWIEILFLHCILHRMVILQLNEKCSSRIVLIILANCAKRKKGMWFYLFFLSSKTEYLSFFILEITILSEQQSL